MTDDNQVGGKTVAERVGLIRNPLTIIAIFAGIAEVSGTIVLPLLTSTVQTTFVWFVMFFPVLLVVLFFSVLLFKNGVLYAPSDYSNEANFIAMQSRFSPASPAEIKEKIISQIEAASGSAGQVDHVVTDSTALRDTGSVEKSKTIESLGGKTQDPAILDENKSVDRPAVIKTIKDNYYMMEKLILSKIRYDLKVEIDEDIKLTFLSGRNIVFDGAYEKNGKLHAVEIKRYDRNMSPAQVRKVVMRLLSYSQDEIGNFELDFIFYSDAKETGRPNFEPFEREYAFVDFEINFKYIDINEIL